MSKLTTPFLLNFLEMVLLRGFQERCNTPPTGARRRRHLVKSCSYFLVKSNAVSISWHHITSSKAESRKVLWVFHHQNNPITKKLTPVMCRNPGKKVQEPDEPPFPSVTNPCKYAENQTSSARILSRNAIKVSKKSTGTSSGSLSGSIFPPFRFQTHIRSFTSLLYPEIVAEDGPLDDHEILYKTARWCHPLPCE